MSAEGVASESQEEQIWLWQEGGRVAWWSPSARGDLDRARPGRLDLCNLSDLRSGFDQAEIRAELGRDSKLAEAVCQALGEGRPVRLRLLRDLSDDDPANDWTRVPFEWMRWNGEPLHGRLTVERFVPTEAVEPLEPLALRHGVKVFKRLSPEDDREFSEAFSPDGHLPRFDEIEVFDEALSAGEFCDPALDLDRLSALVLVCHGTEGDGGSPFRLPDGSSWALPHNRGMPPLVFLLVCGSDAGNLLGYARDALLLPQSTQTVIAAAGKLGLNAAGQFLRRFLEEWADGRAVSEIVRDAQAAVARDPDGLDARRLCVMGRGDLRLGAPPGASLSRPWLEWADDELAARIRDGADEDAAALTTLVNRCTLRCLMEGAGGYEGELRKRLKMSRHESHAELLHRCLGNAGSGASGPVQLWRLSEGWVMLALGMRDQLLERREEFEQQRHDFMPFPAQGDPGRATPRFRVDDLPSPIALAWEQVNDTLDRQQLPDALLQLKEAFEVVVRFAASVAVMDLLYSSAEDRAQARDRDQLIGRLFRAQTTLDPGDWVDCLRIALRDMGATRLLGQLRDVAFRNRSPSRLMNLLTGEYVAWQNADNYDMRHSPAELVPQLLAWLERLRELLEEVSKAWGDWTFKDAQNGTRWHGPSVDTPLNRHEQRLEGEPASLLLVHGDGRSLDLSPLITVQRCDRCRRGRVFFFTERRTGTAGAGAEFRDYPSPHENYHPHVSALAALGHKSPAEAATRRGDEAARAEEEQFAFRDFANAEKPSYLYEALRNACDELDNGRGAGYVHMSGPEGFGKSWFVRKFAEDAREVLGQRVLLCRISALGPDAAAHFIDHLCAQARDQGLEEVDKARVLALDRAAPEEQFATLVRELIELNDLDRLTTVIDGLDELPEPANRPSRLITRRRTTGPQVVREQAYGSPGDEGFAEISDITFEQRTALDELATLEIDEVAEAVVTESDERFLLDFLPPVDRLPTGVFVLLTSREVLGGRATEVLAELRTSGGWIELHLNPDSAGNREVVSQYIQRHVKRRSLLDSIMRRSGGVFLWAYHLVQAIVQGAFQERNVLPEGEEFYSAYLDKLRRREGDELFDSVYLRLLLLLAAAQEPVTAAQLTRWGLSDGRLRSALGLLRDFLSVRHAPRRFAINHEGLQRYMAGDVQMARCLAETHAAIADLTFSRFTGRWGELDLATIEDQYAIRFLPTHVEAGIRVRSLKEAEVNEQLSGLKTLAQVATKRTSESSVASRIMIAGAMQVWADVLARRGYSRLAETAYGHTISSQSRLVEKGHLSVRRDLAAALRKRIQNRWTTFEPNDKWVVDLDEAIELRRELLAEGQQEERAALADLYWCRGITLWRLDRLDSAIASNSEAIFLWRELVSGGQKSFRNDLFTALGFRQMALWRLNRTDEELATLSEEIVLLRELVSEGQVALRKDLARALGYRQTALQKRKRNDEVFATQSEKIALLRELVAAGHEVERRDLALALYSQGLALAERRRRDETWMAFGEAIAVWRELVAMGHVTERNHLASSLVQLGLALSKLGRLDEALAAFCEATAVQRELVAEGRLKLRPSLALSLNNKGNALQQLGRYQEAIDACDESIALRRALLSEGQLSVRRGLGHALGNRGTALTELGRNAEAIAAFEEATAMARNLIVDGPAEAKDDFVRFLRLRGNVLRALARDADGLSSICEAIGAARGFISAGFKEVREPMADALTDQGEALLDESDVKGARASLEEAIAIFEELTAGDPKWELKKELAKALIGYARVLDHLGRTDDAQSSRARAAALVDQKPQEV